MPNLSVTRAVTAPGRRATVSTGSSHVPVEMIGRRIYAIRSLTVMVDSDLAELYQVETKALSRAVKRNPTRFPADFMFRLTAKEAESLRCQSGTSKEGRGGRRYLPYASRKIERLEQTQKNQAHALAFVVQEIQNLDKKMAREFQSLAAASRRKARIGFITAPR